MAREIVQYVWCDRHMEQHERREAKTIALRVGRVAGEVDLCDECQREVVAPVEALLKIHRKPIAEPAAGEEGGAREKNRWYHSKGRYPDSCPVCAEQVIRANMRTHLIGRHGISASELFGARCAIDGTRLKSHQGLATHLQFHEGIDGWKGMVEEAERLGDPHGVAAQIRQRIEKVKNEQGALVV